MAKKEAPKSMRDKMRERAQTRENTSRGGMKFIFPDKYEAKFIKIDKEGTRKFDFIPYVVEEKKHPAGVEPGDMWYQRTIWTHNGVGPEEKSYLCLKTIGKKCPICEYRAQLMKDANADEDLIKSLNAKEREIFQVIDLENEKEGIQLWEYSYHLFGKLLEEEIRNGDEEYAGFADLEGGHTLHIRFSKKKMGKNEFYEAKRIDFKEREDYDEDILDDTLELGSILNVLDYAKLEGIFLDTDPEPEDKPARGRGKKDDEEESGRKRSRASKDDEKEEKSSRRSKKDEEETDDDPPSRSSRRGKKEEKEEEPEEEKPSRRSSRNKKEEEEEPEEKPSRRSKKEEKEEKPSRRGKKEEKEELAEDECPAGGEFGADEGEHDECFECDNWEACKELSDEKKAAAKKSNRRR